MLKRKGRKSAESEREKTRQFVNFQIGEELYGIDIHSVQEIDRMHSITKLPKTLPFIEGVINLRGHIIPVIDMAKRFGMPPVQVGRQTLKLYMVPLIHVPDTDQFPRNCTTGNDQNLSLHDSPAF